MLLFIILALIGLLISLAVHVSTFFGVSPQDAVPGIWLLHIGIFIVFIPAVVAQNTMRRPDKRPGSAGDKTSSDAKKWDVLSHAPRWLRVLASVAFVYCILNFVVFLVREKGSPTRQPNGSFALMNKSTFVRSLTPSEYYYLRALEVRGFSGHWIMFYFMAMTLLVSARRARRPRPDEPSPLLGSSAPAGPSPGPGTGSRTASRPIPVLPYGHKTRHLPSIWLHGTCIMMTRLLWVGLPAILAFTLFPLIPKNVPGSPCLLIFLFLGSAVFGVTVPAMLLKRYLPARCPTCGGSAYCESIHPPRYVCRACGRMHEHD